MEAPTGPNKDIYRDQNTNSRSQRHGEDATQLLSPLDINYDRCIQEPLGQFVFYSVYVVVAVSLGIASNYAAVLSPTLSSMPPTWTCTIALTHRRNEFDPGFVGKSDCNCPEDARNYSNVENFFSTRRSFQLVCDKQYAFAIMSSLVMAGGLLGTIFVGQAGDIFGRRLCLIVTAVGGVGANVLYSYASTFVIASSAIVLIGFFAFGHNSIAYTNLFESVGIDYRLPASCFNVGNALGFAFIATLGLWWNSWWAYQRAVAVVQVLVAVVWCFAQESPRWLIRMNKLDAAAKAIRKIAKFNRTLSPLTIPGVPSRSYGAIENDEAITSSAESRGNKLLRVIYEHSFRNELEAKQTSYLDLFRRPEIRRSTFLMVYLWLVSNMIAYSLYGSLGTIGGSVYWNAGLTAVIKFSMGLLPLAANHWVGRRPLLLVSLCVVGISMSMIGIVKTAYPAPSRVIDSIVIVCSLIGVAGMEPLWKVVDMYPSEIFPTVIRSQACGLCSFGGRVGGILAPLAIYLSNYYMAAPYYILAAAVAIQFSAAYVWLPETKGKPLMDNIEQEEER